MTNEIKEIIDELESMFEISELEEQVNNINKIKNCITDLQSKIDKAIEYILENICCDTRIYTKSENVYKVVDILRGDE